MVKNLVNLLYETLSDRELQVLKFIASGKTASGIGREISLTVITISTYRARIPDKLNSKNNEERLNTKSCGVTKNEGTLK